MRDIDALLNEIGRGATPSPPAGQANRDIEALANDLKQQGTQSFGGRMSQAASDAWSGIEKGMGDTASSIAAIPGAVAGIPSQVMADLSALLTDPRTAIPAQGKRAASFAWGMVPMAETIGKMVSGEPLTVEGIAQDATRYGLSRLVPPLVGGAVKRAVPAVVKALPGAGVALHDLAIEKANQLVAKLTPGTQAVRDIYQRASGMGNPRLDMADLRQTAAKVLNNELQAVKPNADLIAQAQAILQSSDTGWDWSKASSEAGRLGLQLKAIKRQIGEVPAEYTNLYRALRNDMEQANVVTVEQAAKAAQPASILVDSSGQPLRPASPAEPAVTSSAATEQSLAQSAEHVAAQKLARKQFAAEDLANQINKAMGVQGDAYNSFSVNKVIKWIQQQEAAAQLGHPDRQAKLFVESFTPADLSEIKSTLKTISQGLPALPTKTGQAVGSSQRLVQTIAGEAAGHAMGAPPAVGALVGYMGADALAAALTTRAGRKMVVTLSQISPVTSPQFNASLGAWLRTQGYTGAQSDQAEAAPTPPDQHSPAVPPELRDVVSGDARAFLKPSAAEGTIPTAREQAILGLDLQRFAKTNQMGYYRSRQDGSEVVFNPGAVSLSILKQLDKTGRLPEIVNGQGTAPKPANPTTAVTARTPTGTEIRTVLTQTPTQTQAAVAAQPPSANVQVQPAYAIPNILLERLRQLLTLQPPSQQ